MVAAEDAFQEIAVHGLFGGVLSGVYGKVLEWYRKIASVCALEILLHAIVEVAGVRLVLPGPFGDELEGLAHAIFCHFLFGLPQFLELCRQDFEGLPDVGVVL